MSMTDLPDAPDGWTAHTPATWVGDTDPYRCKMLLQRRRDGLVLAVERSPERNRGTWAVLALPANYPDGDDVPIRSYGDDGCLWDGDDLDAAKTAAVDWATEHPR